MPSSGGASFEFDNTYARLEAFSISCQPDAAPAPQLLRLNHSLAKELGLDVAALGSCAAEVFSGTQVPAGAEPIAQAYAGHQFGGFSPQLGDGRALLLGEVIDVHGRRRDIALKGSGPTPFSRGGDGKAAVGPVLREYLIGEAMHALGVPTTRALAAVSTGELVRRERPLPGAVLARVAASHVRVGTFQFFAARRQYDHVRMLADYVIERHDLTWPAHSNRYLGLLEAVADRQAALLAKWMLVGFIHGVMNTDNMAVSGETIDYGPCAFMEAYQSRAVFSSIDSGGRYAYQNQPLIANWNLARFAETLLPLIDEASPEAAVAAATDVLAAFPERYASYWIEIARSKMGLENAREDDVQLAQDWLELLEQQAVDFTLAWRRLADAEAGDAESLTSLFSNPESLAPWLQRWRGRLAAEETSDAARRQSMRQVNPIYIPRNHLVEEVLAAASDHGDLEPLDRLLEAVTRPFEERADMAAFAQPAPKDFTACYKTFCGT